VNIKLPAKLGIQAAVRINQIVQTAPRNPDGTLTAEGSQFIRDTVTAEFGDDLADSLFSGATIEFDYSQKPSS